MRDLDWRAALIGGAVAIGVALPSLLIGAALSDDSDGSNAAVAALVFIVFVAPLAGGYVAARSVRGQQMTPFIHGAAAGAIGWLVVVVNKVVRVVFGDASANPLPVLIIGIVYVSVGMLGGYLAFRRNLRKEDSDQSSRR